MGNDIKISDRMEEDEQRRSAYLGDKVQIKFFVKIDNNEETHLLMEDSKFDDLFENIKANHPYKQDYWVKLIWNDKTDNKPVFKNQNKCKDRSCLISLLMPSLVKDYETLLKSKNSIECHLNAEFIIKPKLIVEVYLDKPSDDFSPMIKKMLKKETYAREPVFNLNSSHSKLTREEGEILLIIADDTKIEEIVSEEINTISRLIVV